MKRSRFGLMWYREWQNVAMIVDLADWGFRVKFTANWEIQVLCIKVGR